MPLRGAVSGADITVVHLRAPLDLLHTRLRSREVGGDPTWYMDAAAHLSRTMRPAELADHVVDNDTRPARAVAADILRRVGWLPAGGL